MQVSIMRVAVAILATFSLAVSVQVWGSFSANNIELFMLCLAAVGIEGAKLLLVPAAYKQWMQQDGRAIPASILAVTLTLVSIFTMASYFDSRLSLQVEKSKVMARNSSIVDTKLDAAKAYIELDRVTKGKELLHELETTVTPVTAGVSPLLQSLANDSGKRHVTLFSLAGIIDVTTVVLLLLLVDVTPKPSTQDAPAVTPKQSKTVKTEPETVEQEILNLAPGEPIGVKKLINKYAIRHPEITAILAALIDAGEVIREGNRYIRARSLRAVK